MSYEHYIGVIDEESVLAECGPMRLVIRAWKKDKSQINLARWAAEQSFTYLERIARYRSALSRPLPKIEAPPEDELAMRMVNSVNCIGDDDLTPMAAVAGTIADAVADWLFERGVTKVIVDNGGDIAIRLAEDETATVGIRPKITSPLISHLVRGVTTSGVGGRSFTRGIASAVTVLAANASVADAAATAIANACYVADDSIIQLPAEQIDPNSDLAGINVTAEIGALRLEKTLQAIDHARQRAEQLCQNGVIVGAFIALENVFALTDGMKKYALQVSGNSG
jgi:ApbE superfamily uncharacterized protein (UPF0280 family)